MAERKKATVFNPQTKERKEVFVGDPNAFAGGFELETQSPASLEGTLEAPGGQTQLPNASQQIGQFSAFRNLMEDITNQQVQKRSVRDVLSETQKQLGGERGVTDPALAGGIIDRGTQAKVKSVEDIFRQTLRTVNSLEKIKQQQTQNVNSLMGSLASSGMLSQLTGDEFNQIMQTGQLPLEVLTKISQGVEEAKIEPPKFISATAEQEAGFVQDGVFTPLQPRGVIQATGDIQTTNLNNRDINIDSVATPSLDAINQASQEFGGLKIGGVETSSFRTGEQQQDLYDKFLAGGPQAAAPGQSAHERGLAIDLFPDQEYIEKMRPIMEANGWSQNAGPHDAGHFEYVGTQQEPGRARKDALLAQIKNGLLTKGDATDIINEFEDDEEFLSEVTEAFNDPKNKVIGESLSTKFNTPTLITKGQFDNIIQAREDAGFGNKFFQGQKEKEYNNIVSWIEMQKDLVSIRALKEGGDFIKTLSEDEQQRILDDFGDTFKVDTVEKLVKTGEVNTGPITGRTLGARELIPGQSGKERRQVALDTLSGKYTVEFMKEASGVAISENEAKRLQKLVPNIKLQDFRFKTDAKDAQDTLNEKLLAAANRFGFTTITGMVEATNKTRSGEFFEIDDRTLSLDSSEIQGEVINSGQTSSGIKYQIIQE